MRQQILWNGLAGMEQLKIELGVPDFRLSQSYWVADHIIPVWAGGGQVGLEGIQTLCSKCHAIKSRFEAAQRAKRVATKRSNLH
jgi:5-methylcytosine-specific restriction endonuclease McrA